jgi:hypothetical protein
MAPLTLEEMQADERVLGVARALALANEAAKSEGADPALSRITISEEPSAQGRIWRVNYGPRDYVGRRGGDIIVFVDEAAGKVQRTMRGQ